jgi:hypothetical protein
LEIPEESNEHRRGSRHEKQSSVSRALSSSSRFLLQQVPQMSRISHDEETNGCLPEPTGSATQFRNRTSRLCHGTSESSLHFSPRYLPNGSSGSEMKSTYRT